MIGQNFLSVTTNSLFAPNGPHLLKQKDPRMFGVRSLLRTDWHLDVSVGYDRISQPNQCGPEIGSYQSPVLSLAVFRTSLM